MVITGINAFLNACLVMILFSESPFARTKCTICAKDFSGFYDYDVKKHLIDLARKHQIPYTVDIYPYYGSDASAAQRAGGNFKAGLIGPGVDASHNKERIHSDAIQATVDLAILFAKNPL